MQLPITEIQETLEKIILDKSSLTPKEAKILAADYLEGELEGKKTHGLAAFPAIVPVLGESKADYEVVKETDAFIFADAHGSFGAIVGHKLADAAMAKAKTAGVAMVAIKDMKSWLRPGAVAQYVAEQGMVGWAVNTGGASMVAPPGGRDPVVGTNPIGIGIPTEKAPLVVDMATSVYAWGVVRQALRFNHELPADSFTDDRGLPTTDAEAAHAVRSIGDYKGFGLGLFIEIMCGSFIGMDMSAKARSQGYQARNRGAFIMVINPELTIGTDNFKAANQELIDFIRSTPPAEGSKGITLPGDRSSKTKQASLEAGTLEVDDSLWQEIISFL